MKQFLLILVSVILGSIGQVLLKLGANKLGSLSLALHTFWQDFWRLAKTPEIISGLFLFGLSCLLWIKVLIRDELSYAYPMVSLGYINIAVLSYLLFNEAFTISKIMGIALIIAGVFVLNH